MKAPPSWLLWCVPIIFISISLLPDITKCSRLILCLPVPAWESAVVPLVGNGVRDDDLNARCAYCYWVSLALGPFSRRIRNDLHVWHINTCIHTHIHTRDHKHAYTHIHTHIKVMTSHQYLHRVYFLPSSILTRLSFHSENLISQNNTTHLVICLIL